MAAPQITLKKNLNAAKVGIESGREMPAARWKEKDAEG